MKKYLYMVIAIIIAFGMFGCTSKEEQAPTVAENANITSAETIAQATENIEDNESEAPTESEVIVIEGESLEETDKRLEEMGYPAIQFTKCYRITNPIVTKDGDSLLVSFMSNGVPCEVRAQHTDGLKNISGVEIPEGVKNIGEDYNGVQVEMYSWSSDMGERDVVINYYPDEGLTYTFTGNDCARPADRIIIDKVNKELVNYDAEIDYSQTITDVAVWEIFGEIKHYEYRVGMNVGQWVDSQYNTDGWYRLNNMVVNKDKTVYAWPDTPMWTCTQLIKY